MKTNLLGIIIIALGIQSLASAEIVKLNPIQTKFSFFANTRDFSIRSIHVSNEPTLIEKNVDCDADDFCRTKTIETRQVVKVKFSYIDDSNEEGLSFEEAMLPAEDFSSDVIGQIKNKSNFTLDPFGKKTRALKNLAIALTHLKVLKLVDTVTVVDQNKSRFCEIGDYNCKEHIVYKKVQVKKNIVEVSAQ